MHINSIFSLHFIFPHPPPALIIINFRFLSAIGEWLRSWYGCTPTPPGGQRRPSGLWPPSRGWIQWNSLGPPLALSPFSRQTNLKCNNMAIVVYCYENLLIVRARVAKRSEWAWMGCGFSMPRCSLRFQGNTFQTALPLWPPPFMECI